MQRSVGRASVRFERRADGRTALADLQQAAPCRALLPASEDWPTAVFATTCGGLTGGDAVRFDFAVDAGAAARATTQAAERLYKARAADAPARIASRVVLGTGASAEWLPQETIVFDGARLERRTVFELAVGADVLACELRILGRAAHGEVFRDGFLSDRIEVWRQGTLLWVDALRLGHSSASPPEAQSAIRGLPQRGSGGDPGPPLGGGRESGGLASPETRSAVRGLPQRGSGGDPGSPSGGGRESGGGLASPEARSAIRGLPQPGSGGDPGSPPGGGRESGGVGRALASPAGFGGYPAIATVFHAAGDAEARLGDARALLASMPLAACAAATAFDGLLVARFLASDAFTLRQAVAGFVAGYRAILGRAPAVPRFWSL